MARALMSVTTISHLRENLLASFQSNMPSMYQVFDIINDFTKWAGSFDVKFDPIIGRFTQFSHIIDKITTETENQKTVRYIKNLY